MRRTHSLTALARPMQAAVVLAVAAYAALAEAEPEPTPAPYSLPWQLRPIVPATAFRFDSSLAARKDAAGNGAFTMANIFNFALKATDSFAPFVRFGVVDDVTKQADSPALLDPMLGALFSTRLGHGLRLGVMAAVALPIGQGGGDHPDAGQAAAMKAGVFARSGMDNVLFGPNDLGLVEGLDLAYIAHGLTLQAEGTVIEAIRVRGAAAQPDAEKTNSTFGLYGGYFVTSFLSLGAELRAQVFLSTPAAVKAGTSAREQLSVAAGPRFHVHAGGVWLRPGISYARGFEKPMSTQDYNIVQIDLPFVF
jgi:hypothetical protein